MAVKVPTIPTNIIVHLGEPNTASRNITVPFQDYIKNVASTEIYPTWPDDAIRANVLAQISFALNRIYNEWYPSRGYNFDITNLPSYDQAFVEDRAYFENVSLIVDEIFNNYIVKGQQIQPYFAQYCDGKNVKCDGLSQWGSVSLANQNKSPIDILKYYYGNDISLIENAEVSDNVLSFPGFDLKIGTGGNMVRTVQRELNRIAVNYPSIPKITDVNGLYDYETEEAVRKFQEIFNLNITGSVDKSTWYKIKYIYNSVKKISDLASEGILAHEADLEFSENLKYSDTGFPVRFLHYYLRTISAFDPDIPILQVNSYFNENTREMVIAFQNKYGLPANGIVDAATWTKLKEIYNIVLASAPRPDFDYIDELYPGYFLIKGMQNPDVLRLQRFLLKICQNTNLIPGVRVSGIFDDLTERSVKSLQGGDQYPLYGIVGPLTWEKIVALSKG